MNRTALFTVAIAVGAGLVMVIQPMSAKAVLPDLGGTPAVWNASMLFFQVALLLGYLLAHGLTRIRRAHTQVLLHAALLGVAAATLPLSAPSMIGAAPPTSGGEVQWIVLAFARTILAPLLLVAAGAPLLMRWFARTGARGADDPHFLYAASNAGSLLGLLAYPFLIEPFLSLPAQRLSWSVGFATFAALAFACGVTSLRPTRRPDAGDPAPRPPSDGPPPRLRTLAWWALLAFAPASLMLGVTQHVTTDVATIPLFWVVPLAIYLATFVLTFARHPVVSPAFASLLVVPIVAASLVATAFWWAFPVTVLVGTACVLLLCGGIVAHGRLAAERPDPSHLTWFYLAIAVGGAGAGAAHALVAPVVFDAVYEYPLAMGLCALLRDRRALTWPSATGARLLQRAADIVLLLLLFVFVPWNERVIISGARLVSAERTFFGLHRVLETDDGDLVRYHHGTTVHGLQRRSAPRQPLAYYHEGSGVGRLLAALEGSERRRRVGFVGLGAGALAAWSTAGDRWTFFEIDDEVVRIARDAGIFTYLSDAAGEVDVVVGDARRSLAARANERFGALVLDAFSSDAVPTHLLTEEAFALYRERLAPDGLIVVHVTNRHVDLARVVAATAAAGGLETYLCQDEGDEAAERLDSAWVVVAKSKRALPFAPEDQEFARLAAREGDPPWRDDFANLLYYMKWWR